MVQVMNCGLRAVLAVDRYTEFELRRSKQEKYDDEDVAEDVAIR